VNEYYILQSVATIVTVVDNLITT